MSWSSASEYYTLFLPNRLQGRRDFRGLIVDHLPLRRHDRRSEILSKDAIGRWALYAEHSFVAIPPTHLNSSSQAYQGDVPKHLASRLITAVHARGRDFIRRDGLDAKRPPISHRGSGAAGRVDSQNQALFKHAAHGRTSLVNA